VTNLIQGKGIYQSGVLFSTMLVNKSIHSRHAELCLYLETFSGATLYASNLDVGPASKNSSLKFNMHLYRICLHQTFFLNFGYY